MLKEIAALDENVTNQVIELKHVLSKRQSS